MLFTLFVRRNKTMNDANKLFDETGKIITWMCERLTYLPAEEQLILVASCGKMVEEIKPIYEKDKKRIEDEEAKKRKDDLDLIINNILKKRGDND